MAGPLPTACSTSGAALTAFQEDVLAWGRRMYRDLPWRRSRDPWAILVSELMLQQTQVTRVVSRWDEFLHLFPTPATCAAAPVGDVVRAWAGLGYNRRAVSLHRAAALVVERHAGSLPDDLGALLSLPGVGPYTARAVQAFAFGLDVGLVETNSARLLARGVAGQRMTAAEAQACADRSVPSGLGWAWNQAVMDLGATVCRRRVPSCADCPVAASCAWNAAGRRRPDPAEGSAGVSTRQAVFAGSDREGRGRLVTALRTGAVAIDDLAVTAGWPDERQRARRMADGLVSDGLARWNDGALCLS